MLKDSGTERAELLAQHWDETFAGAQTAWSGPPAQPERYVFEMRGANKRIVIDERVFDLWGGSKPGLTKTLDYYEVDKHVAQCPAGSTLHIKPGNGEKPEFATE